MGFSHCSQTKRSAVSVLKTQFARMDMKLLWTVGTGDKMSIQLVYTLAIVQPLVWEVITQRVRLGTVGICASLALKSTVRGTLAKTPTIAQNASVTTSTLGAL